MSLVLKALQALPGTLAGLFRQAGWPALVGLLATVVGLALLLAAWPIDRQTRRLYESRTTAPTVDTGGGAQARQFARATEAHFTIPEDQTHIEDLEKLFKLAKAQGVQIGTVEYRQSPNPSLQVTVRTLEVRIQEDYPRLKVFLADLLGNMPHMSLQEIRVDRKDASTPQGQVLLKLSFVYRVSGMPAATLRTTP
ncbi:MAG: hypothetical protein ACK5N7_12190 [Curvibacter sp.]|jgi:hypothetical protein